MFFCIAMLTNGWSRSNTFVTPSETVASLQLPGLCADGHCLDEGLVQDLDQRLTGARGTQLWVLHMLGNHGPSYFRRYPARFARFQPECREDDLRRCSRDEVVNAYDNALLYTDHVLATLIGKLQARAKDVDVAMLYVSDHGESLGEHGLYLHGVPYDYRGHPALALEIEAVSRVLASGRVNYWTGTECREFEREFAAWCGTPHIGIGFAESLCLAVRVISNSREPIFASSLKSS